MNSSLIRKAIVFSMEKHKHQKRQKNDYPYIVHPISVFSIVKKYKHSKNSEMILCSALLHDVLEDTDATYEELVLEFHKDIADIVLELTKDPLAMVTQTKIEYMKEKMMNMSNYALVIKLADNLDNMTDNPSETQLVRYLEVIEHVKTHRQLSTTHKKLIKEIEEAVGLI